MSDDQKSKADLIEELTTLRRQLKTSEAICNKNLNTVIRDSVDGILVVDPKGVKGIRCRWSFGQTKRSGKANRPSMLH